MRDAGYMTIGHFQGAWPSTFINLDQGYNILFHRGIPIYKPFKTLDDAIMSLYNAVRAIVEEKFLLESSVMTDQAIRYIRENAQSGPFFLHVAWNYTHDPYEPPKEFRNKFIRQNEISEASKKIAMYDAEINFVDYHVGRVIRALEKNGLLDNSWIILFADHGEELARKHEDGRVLWGHSNWVYDSSVNIPLIIRPPNNMALSPHQIDSVVESVDITPTILTITGLDTAGLDGFSLEPFFRGESRTKKWAYSVARAYDGELESSLSIRTNEWRYIETYYGPNKFVGELYHHDPNCYDELNNLYNKYPDIVEILSEKLRHWQSPESIMVK